MNFIKTKIKSSLGRGVDTVINTDRIISVTANGNSISETIINTIESREDEKPLIALESFGSIQRKLGIGRKRELVE